MLRQSVEPAELVIELGSRRGIAVRQIEPSDDHAVHRLNVAAVRVIGIAGQAPADFHGLSAPRQDRDAVPAFLPMPDGAITGGADALPGYPYSSSAGSPPTRTPTSAR